MTDLERRGLLAAIVGRLPACAAFELRVVDLVLERLEFARTGPDRTWNFAADLCDSLIRALQGALAERDRQTVSCARPRGPLAEWHPSQHETRVSDVPAQIAARDIDEDKPYEEWGVSEEEQTP